MLKLIKNVKIFNPRIPEPKDLLIAGQKIVALEETDQIKLQGLEYQTIDGCGLMAVPGFVDPHVHILGGGGEGGPATRAPEIRIENCLSCGVTSVIGCLGTDSITRHLSSLLAKARALEIEGLSTWIFTGAYNLPTPTITGSVRSDLALIDKVIGAGEIALSDHRSSQPTYEEFLHLVAECRVGGMLGGKAGVAHFHLGDGRRGLEYLFRMAKETEIPVTQVIPTHITRGRSLFDQGLEWLKLGGLIDLTAGLEPVAEGEVSVIGALEQIKSLGWPLSRVTISSDSNGSLPVFDDQGRLVGLTVASQKAFIQIFQEVVRKNILSLEEASELFSSNAASFYKLPGKGKLLTGYDADLLLFDESLELKEVFSQGKWLVQNGVVKARGTFSV
ncbi:MAG: beta-aspartyl-peptidase [Acidobacteriota bacterium]|nr:beta-aspartyl-peptidase [Acidobacteriota bacterium]MDW3228979.1 beta-aspartyl-peptidase [Acidobacteriota bacterium]MDY0231861.1 beta-aspartyl-peptidase [Candidatus Saccharicenans sp.]